MNEYIESVINEYLQPLFYFSIKKTSNIYEAEDLSQEIVLEIMKSLSGGNIPDDVKAWVWKIARNRYARWAERQKRTRAVCNIDDMSDVISDGSSIEDDIIGREEFLLLRRELSLLSCEYRNIVCEYYFNNRSLADIAASLGLLLGTVKYKIHECRKNLKEGMKMSREYGKRSFAPETVKFFQNWNTETGPDGRRYINRIAPQNILLEAYDNPCTAEDLSLALGIAMPYMEEEIKLLLEGELLIQDGDSYKTNMVILSKEAQDQLYDASEKAADRLVPFVMKAVDEISDKPELPKNQCFEDMKPSLITLLLEYIEIPAVNPPDESEITFIKHKDGSEWALVGMVKTDKAPKYLEECGNNSYDQIIMLGNRTYDLSTDIDKSAVPVFKLTGLDDLIKTSFTAAIIDILCDFNAEKAKIFDADIPDYLKNTAVFYNTMDIRRLCLDRAIDCGYVKLHEDMNKSAMGIWNYSAE